MTTAFQPNTVLRAAQLNAAFATKANLDPATGKVRAAELPDLGAIADEALDARMPAINASIAAVQSDADAAAQAAATAQGAADAAQADADAAAAAAAAALAAAQAAQGDADEARADADAAVALAGAAIPLSEKGAAGGVASLGSDGKVPAAQLPPLGSSSGSARAWANFDGRNGTIRASENIASVTLLAGTGNYRVSFVNPMPHANFAAVFGGRFGDEASDSTVAIVAEPRSVQPTRSASHIDLKTNWQDGWAGGTSGSPIHTVMLAVFA